MIDFKFEYRVNDEYFFESLVFQDFICFNLFNKRSLKIACIAWQFDSKQDLNDFMVRFVKENYKYGYNRAWEAIYTHCIGEQYLIRAVGYADAEFLALGKTDCFPKLKEALTKHYCPELLQGHSVDVNEMIDDEIVLNGVKYRRVE